MVGIVVVAIVFVLGVVVEVLVGMVTESCERVREWLVVGGWKKKNPKAKKKHKNAKGGKEKKEQ